MKKILSITALATLFAARVALFVVCTALLAACADDEQLVRDDEPQRILFGTSRSASVEWIDGRPELASPRAASSQTRTASSQTRAASSQTRAVSDEIEATTPQTIGVFAFGQAPGVNYVFENQKVYFKDNEEYAKGNAAKDDVKFPWEYRKEGTTELLSDWPYHFSDDEPQRLWKKIPYRFFAYSPWYPNEDVEVEGRNYSTFNTFVWKNIPGFSGDDFMLANSIVAVDNTGSATEGPKDWKTSDLVVFEMRHILSRIRFFFKLSPAYRTIRSIRINSVTVITAGKIKSATFNFNSNNKWDETVHWGEEVTGNAEPVELHYTEGGAYELEVMGENLTDWPSEPFASIYVYPQNNFEGLELRVNYTCFDAKGMAVREAEVANKIDLPTKWNLLAGYYYDLRLLISPTFLYVLSDNDQDFDGCVVVKEKG